MESFRVVTLNLWGEQPPLAERLAVAESGLRALAPDAIALQEVRQVPGRVENTAATLAARLGMEHRFAVATPWGGGDEGLAILSRFPIAHDESVELPHAVLGDGGERRICLGAALTTPDGELPLFVTHLNYRLTDGQKREAQVAAIDDFVTAWLARRPTDLPRILAGDFNAGPAHDEIRFLRGEHTLETANGRRRAQWQDAWVRRPTPVADDPGYTWARANPYTEKLAFLDRDRRIDYLFVSPLRRSGAGEVLDCRVVLAKDEAGVFASDHFGLFAEVRIV